MVFKVMHYFSLQSGLSLLNLIFHCHIIQDLKQDFKDQSSTRCTDTNLFKLYNRWKKIVFEYSFGSWSKTRLGYAQPYIGSTV